MGSQNIKFLLNIIKKVIYKGNYAGKEDFLLLFFCPSSPSEILDKIAFTESISLRGSYVFIYPLCSVDHVTNRELDRLLLIPVSVNKDSLRFGTGFSQWCDCFVFG